MIVLSVVLYSFLLVKLGFKAKITSGTLANMCNYSAVASMRPTEALASVKF